MNKSAVQTGIKFFSALWFISASILAIDTMRASINMPITLFVWELFKVIVGPFLGATFAFSYNRRMQEDRRQEEEAAEVYGAASSIRSMYMDFLRYRRSIHDVAANREQFHMQFDGVAPVWTYASRMLFTFGAAGDADVKALHFLHANEEGRKAFSSYLHLVKVYKDLESAYTLITPIVDSIQDKLEKIETIDWEKDSDAIGPRLTYSVRDLYLGILIRLEDDNSYVRAYEDLEKVAKKHYPKMKLQALSLPSQGFGRADLKPLPPVVIDALEMMRRGDVIRG